MNKIHVVIGEQDEQFLVHLVNIMENGFKEYIEAHCFSKPEFYLKYVRNNGGDVFLVDENFGVGPGELGQENCGYLCDSNDMPVLKGYKTVGKYQRPDAIYAQSMDIYANGGLASVPEAEPEPEFQPEPAGPCEVILVQSFSGGTGASTFAAAASMYSASQETRTFYLNLEDSGSSEDFFTAQGSERIDGVLAEMQKGTGNFAGFAASHAQTDAGTGVSYFLPSANAVAMARLTAEDWLRLLNALKQSGSYERIFVDCGFGLDERHLAMMDAADKIVVVTDGSEPANTKFYRAFDAVLELQEQNQMNLTARMVLLYNCFSSSKSSSRLEYVELPVVGTIPPVKHALVREIIQVMLERQNIFERMLQL